MTAVDYVNEVLDCDSLNISCAEKMVLIQIAITYQHRGSDTYILPGFDELALRSRLSRIQVIKCFRRLGEDGLGLIQYDYGEDGWGHVRLDYDFLNVDLTGQYCAPGDPGLFN
jgi:hypothetical protein